MVYGLFKAKKAEEKKKDPHSQVLLVYIAVQSCHHNLAYRQKQLFI